MRSYVQYLLFVFCFQFYLAENLNAQDVSRKWALNYNASPYIGPVLTSNPSYKTMGRGFNAFTVMGEYYLSEKWTVEGGYYQAEIAYGGHSRHMEGIQLGTKKYFVNPNFFAQPYVSFSSQFNWGRRFENRNSVVNYNDFYIRNPRLSIVPGVGADIYFFTSIAFVIKYNFNIGIGSKTIIDTKPSSFEHAYILKDRGMYHNLELGLKVTFPMRFTDKDGDTLLAIIWEMIFNC